jgi:hypothetical protein
MSDDGPFEQTSIPGQKGTAVSHGSLCEHAVLPITPIESIETTQAQIAGELPQMDVHDETGFTQRSGAHCSHRADIDTLEDRIDADTVAIRDRPLEGNRFPVHQHQIDLGMGHAQTFDQVLDRPTGSTGVDELKATVLRPHEIGQFGIETNANSGRRTSRKLSPLHFQGAFQHDVQQ